MLYSLISFVHLSNTFALHIDLVHWSAKTFAFIIMYSVFSLSIVRHSVLLHHISISSATRFRLKIASSTVLEHRIVNRQKGHCSFQRARIFLRMRQYGVRRNEASGVKNHASSSIPVWK